MQTKPYIIGVAGGSGSGKTSLIKYLSKDLREKVCFISLDDYYYPREDQVKDNSGIRNFDLPTSIDQNRLVSDLESLIAGQKVIIEEYTFNNKQKKKSTLVLMPSPVIFVEGLYVYEYKELRPYFDLRLFIDARPDLKLIRRIKRDQIERNYPLDDVLYRYENHVMPSYKEHIEKYIEEAHIVINNNEDYKKAADVIIGFVKSKLMDS